MTSTQAATAVTRAQANLLAQPHHDGSALSVSNRRPQLGDTAFVDAVIDLVTETETWWRADILCRNPVTSRRFILEGGVAGVRTASGRDLIQSGESVTLTADMPEVNIWTWPRA